VPQITRNFHKLFEWVKLTGKIMGKIAIDSDHFRYKYEISEFSSFSIFAVIV